MVTGGSATKSHTVAQIVIVGREQRAAAWSVERGKGGFILLVAASTRSRLGLACTRRDAATLALNSLDLEIVLCYVIVRYEYS